MLSGARWEVMLLSLAGAFTSLLMWHAILCHAIPAVLTLWQPQEVPWKPKA